MKKDESVCWWREECINENLSNERHSSKLILLLSILEECQSIGDKLLVFSQSLYSLDMIERFLRKITDSPQNENTFEWKAGLDYFRLDGAKNIEERNADCEKFNDIKNTRARFVYEANICSDFKN